MQLPAFLVADADDVALSALAREHHVEAQPLSAYYRDEPPRPGFFLGYSGVPERSIRAAVLRLSQALRPYPTPKTAPTLGR
jgi:DNA-binding transcriptional MocR family regulator